MTPQVRIALVRGQGVLGVPRPEAEDLARFVAETLHAAQSVRLNEKATAATVALSALEKRIIVCLDISTEVLGMQEFSPSFSQKFIPGTPQHSRTHLGDTVSLNFLTRAGSMSTGLIAK